MKTTTSHNQPGQPASRHTLPSLGPTISHSSPLSRRELLLLSAILAAGVALRLWALSSSAVEHFDEGVYASNIYFGPPDYAYPLQRFFGPPLLPALIETGAVLQLPPNVAALLPSLLAGCGTIIALWHFGRSWFKPPVGLAAATLAAFSDFHILYNTAALTDALLGLWLLLAVDAVARSLLRSDFRWAVGAGIYTGLAWWTKYNGWLPLVIEAAAILLLTVAEFIRIRGRSKKSPTPKAHHFDDALSTRDGRLKTWLACFAVTSLVAIAAWSPYLLSLRPHGGYGPIAANHAKYAVGLAGWLDSAGRQLANQHALETIVSSLGLFFAAALPAPLGPRSLRQRLLLCGIGAATAIAAYFCTSFIVIAVLSLIGLLRAAPALFATNDDTDQQHPQLTIGFGLLAVWWLGLFLTTPLYTPYARLALPWTLSAYLAAPLCFHSRSQAPAWERTNPRLRLVAWAPLLACPGVLATLIAAGVFLPRTKLHLPHDRRFLQTIAREFQKTGDPNAPRVIYTYAEPALLFQLKAAGEPIVAPIQHLPASAIEGNKVPTFLFLGPHSQQDAPFQREWIEVRDHWKLLQTFDYHPSLLVWLDLHDPRSPTDAQTTHSIHLYQFQP